MKRLLTFLLAAVLFFGIAACEPTDDTPECLETQDLLNGECVDKPVPNVPPVLAGLDDVNLTVGEAYDLATGVTATDDEDGNITANIIIGGNFNPNVAGVYTITYTIIDSDGGTDTGSRTITVNDVPVFSGVADLNLEQGTAFNPATGVTATDAEDGDLTASIVISGDTVDVNTVGSYLVTYTVTDSAGVEVSVDRVITINEEFVNNVPAIAGAGNVVIALGATFDPAAGVTATDFEDGDITTEIVITGTVNTSVAGSYDLTYTITDSNDARIQVSRTVVVNTLPEITGVEDALIYLEDDFVLLDGVTATDAEDGDLTTEIMVSGTVNNLVTGSYTVTYTVYDSDGFMVQVTRVVTVDELDLVYPTGFFNYKFASTELRHTFMAAAEKYLLTTMDAGVPLFANGGFVLYSSRLQLPVEEFVAVMQYGPAFGTMSADDSTVTMYDGTTGNAGEFTYRTTLAQNPTTFQQWIYDDSTSATVIGQFMDALYVYKFNADKTGYEVVPSMASSNPVPQNVTTTETGKEVATIWQIPLRTDLEWFFHPDIDTSALPAGYEVLDANDFVDTYKKGLDENWFRAISGGGSFLDPTSEIVGAQDYVDGLTTWDQVGIRLVDNNTIEFEFVNEMSDWNVRYWLSSFVMTPLNLELYDALEPTNGDPNPYGTSATTIAAHGPYYMDYYEADKVVIYKENPVYHSPDEYFYTGYTYSIIEDSGNRFQEFLQGKLESVGLPTEYYDDYKDHPGIKQIPGATTFRMMINGTGDVTTQQELFPGSTWVPEPLLANQNFKRAMYFAIDRQKLAEQVLKTSTTNMFLFSDLYLVDAELGVPYRSTPQGVSVGEGLSPSTHGYNADAATAYWLLAIEELLAEGAYTAGANAFNPTIIELDFNIFSGSQGQVLMGDYIKTQFESLFHDYNNHIKVEITVVPKEFPSIYYDYMMIGEFDLSIGGISGSQLDAASFLDTYSADNRSGFTLNWGIDTSMAEIEVDYVTFDGVRHLEMWSFDAIASVLNGEKYISLGEEAEIPSAANTNITPTSFTMLIDKFSSPDFNNITYTVEYYDWDTDAYYELPGYVDLVPAAAEVTVTGLTPYFYGYGPNGTIEYRGDYQVVINFGYTVDATKEGSYTTPWFTTDSIFSAARQVGLTSAAIALTLNADWTAALSEVNVYEEQTDGSMLDVTATVGVDSTDPVNILLTGLTSGGWYVVEFVYDDGNSQSTWFGTEVDVAEVTEVEVTDTGATLALENVYGYTGTVTGAVVYLAADDSAVAGATVDFTDLAAILVAGLAAETDYYVTFTFDDGATLDFEFTTAATPAA